MEFNYAMLAFSCACGESAKQVGVGTTSHGFLVGKWTCKKCHRPMMALMSLEKLVDGIPPPPDQKLLPPQTDHDFFKSMGILED